MYKEWCLPGQKVQRSFLVLHHLTGSLVGIREGRLELNKLVFKAVGFCVVKLISRAQFRSVLFLAISGAWFYLDACVGGSVECNSVIALCFISSSEATDIARTASTTRVQVGFRGNTGSRWVKSHLLYHVFS